MVRLLFGFFGSTEQSMSSGPVTQVGKVDISNREELLVRKFVPKIEPYLKKAFPLTMVLLEHMHPMVLNLL